MALKSFNFGVEGQADPIDGTSTGSTLIVEDAGNVHLSPVLLTFETISVDSVTETAIVSVGTNYPNYDDILLARGINPVEGVIETVFLPSSLIFNTKPEVYVRVVRAATGSDLTFVVGLGSFSYFNE